MQVPSEPYVKAFSLIPGFTWPSYYGPNWISLVLDKPRKGDVHCDLLL